MIYDCFTFFNELDILLFRLELGYEYVDKFVIVESTTTFTNKPKELFYENNKAMFSQYADKIIHVICDNLHSNNAWDNERNQRNSILKGLTQCNPDDQILISDVDEIPNYPVIKNTTVNSIHNLDMHMFYYFMTNRITKFLGNPYSWNARAFMAPYKNIKDQNLDGIRLNGSYPKIADGGWHFSYLFGLDYQMYVKKIESFSHTEYNSDRYKDINTIIRKISAGEDLFDRTIYNFETVDFDTFYPDLIRFKKDKIKSHNWIL